MHGVLSLYGVQRVEHRVQRRIQHVERDVERWGNADERVCVERPAERAQEGEYSLYFGDPHVHSSLSLDVDGEPDELYHIGRDVAALDFIALTENDHYVAPLSESSWEQIRRLASFYNAPGEFTAFLGYEYTRFRSDGGGLDHRSVLFPGATGRVFSWKDDAPDVETLTARLDEAGLEALFHHHHPHLDLTDSPRECNVEVCSGWHNCMLLDDYRHALHQHLCSGWRVGFIGGSDNHQRTPGFGGALTRVWAPTTTREDIYEAFLRHRTFATTGLRPVLTLRVGGAFMGEEVSLTSSERPLLEVSVRCEREVERIDLIRGGETVFSRNESDCEVSFAREDERLPPGLHFYYVHVKFKGRERHLPKTMAPAVGVHAWSSPVWVNVASAAP